MKKPVARRPAAVAGKGKGKAKVKPKARRKTPPKAPATAAKVGRPSAYRAPFAAQAYKLCLLGATDVKLAQFFEVSEKTLNTWKTAHPKFLQSMNAGKEIADAEVASSLFHRAKGYSHPDVHVSNFQGGITVTPLTKYYPPDTAAGSLWLRNRQPKLWRDKVDIELGGKDGGPIQTQGNLTVTLSPDEAYKRMLSG